MGRAEDLYAVRQAVCVEGAAMASTHGLRGRGLLSAAAQQSWRIETLGGTAPA